jgi:hypothetical protein
LREADRRINLLGRLAGCFIDGRAPLQVKHRLSEMLAQRIYGLALGYEDLQRSRAAALGSIAGSANPTSAIRGAFQQKPGNFVM